MPPSVGGFVPRRWKEDMKHSHWVFRRAVRFSFISSEGEMFLDVCLLVWSTCWIWLDRVMGQMVAFAVSMPSALMVDPKILDLVL